jgi:hypothetical protein
LRLEAHIAVVCSIKTPSFGGKTDLDELRTAFEVADPATTGGAPKGASGRPSNPAPGSADKKVPPAAIMRSPGPVVPASVTPAQHTYVPLTVDELLVLCADMHTLESWICIDFGTIAAAAVAVGGSQGSQAAVDLRAGDAVRALLDKQVRIILCVPPRNKNPFIFYFIYLFVN